MSAFAQRFAGTPRAFGLEAALEVVVGLAAVSGGLTLVFSPDGSAMGLSSALLTGSGFDSYFVPGLALAIGVGAVNLVAAALNLQGSRAASAASFLAGAALLVFIGTELATTRARDPLQAAMFAIGAAIMILAVPPRTDVANNPRRTS